MITRRFAVWVALLAALRVVPALVVLAADGRSLPGLPGSAYGPPDGDTYGFYAAAREFVSAWGHVSRPLLAVAALALMVIALYGRRAWRRGARGTAVAVVSAGAGAFVALAVRAMVPTGAGAVGWPIVWSLPMFPLRAAHLLSYHVAYYLGVAILLACNVATVVATAVVARKLLPGRVALVAPALLVVWPFLMRLVEGTGNTVYGSWLTDSGVQLYSEPLSTALVAVALALVITRPAMPAAAAAAGALTAFATATRLSNVTVVLLVGAVLLTSRDRRVIAAFTVAAAGVGLIAAEFWSKGYATFVDKASPQAPDGIFSWHYLLRSWRDSGVFDWRMLVLLLPLPLLGAYALRGRRRESVLLGGTIVITAAFYSAYYITALHPRFLFVALPPLFVLAAAGVDAVLRRAVRPG